MIKSRPGLEGVEAIRTGRILPIEYNFTGNSPRVIEGLEQLAAQLKALG